MATSREYLEFIIEQLSELEGITFRQMMGEYIIYYDGKIEFCINKTYAYVNNEKEMPEPSDIRLIIKPKFNETGYSNIEEIKKDLKFIFEQASKYFD